MAKAGGGQATLIEVEIDRLRNSVAHLERSNRELRECLKEAGPDPDFKEAVQDNIVTIAKQRARIASLEEELRKLTGKVPDGDMVSEPVALGVTDAGAGQAAGPATPAPEQGAVASTVASAAAGRGHAPEPQPTAQQLVGAGPASAAGDAAGASSMEVDGVPAAQQQQQPGAAAPTASAGAGPRQGGEDAEMQPATATAATAPPPPATAGRDEGVWL